MNPSYRTFKFPQIKAQTWDEVRFIAIVDEFSMQFRSESRLMVSLPVYCHLLLGTRTCLFPSGVQILPAHATAEVASLCAVLLAYIPDQRITMLDALSHPFFEEIRQPGTSLDGNPLPELFSFVPEEMDSAPDVYDSLVPGHVRA
eukprot:TRINITY_DN11833_c0_g1_i13.p3 TRINITY_DN11833_c0_g1~~TRINITY_DN11833_c0_g1_i13.p3  ORF type:complete len:145 (+),score=2.89 TRINITY_DN11833_c0_g1_i13:1380-1814(+)